MVGTGSERRATGAAKSKPKRAGTNCPAQWEGSSKMNCAMHPDTPAIAYCRTCGKPVCQVCQRVSGSSVFCPDHSQDTAPPPSGGAGEGPSPYANPYSAANPYPPPGVMTPDAGASPGLAFLLGWIPG